MNINKKQLKEISKALGAAATTHAKHKKYIDGMLSTDKKSKSKLEQPRYNKELFGGFKHSGTGGGGNGAIKKTVQNIKRKIQSRPSKSDKEFVAKRNAREASKKAEEAAIAESNSMILNDQGYTNNFTLNQSRKVLHQVSTGQQAGVGPTGNFPTAPNYVPPPPVQAPPPPPVPVQTTAVTPPPPPMPVNPSQQVPMVPQEKYDPIKADINKNGTVEDWEKAKVSKFTK